MAEFVPINNQEEFNAAIGPRLQRERQTIMAQYSDYEDLKKKVGTLETQVSTLTGEKEALEKKVKGHETNSVKMRIAQEKGLPAEMALRLTGETEEDIAKDADSMVQIFKATKGTAPLFDNTSGAGDDQDAALKQMLQNLNM